MRAASLTQAETVAIVVHGVGDHSGGRILQKAIEGLKSFTGTDVNAETVTILGLPELGKDTNSSVGLEIKVGEEAHFVVPVVWSRLRPRAANEADFRARFPGPASRIFDRLFHPVFYLAPACINALRCIPAAPGILRRSLVAIVALSYAVFVPSFLLCGFYFISYLSALRLQLDNAHYIWWRLNLLLVICWLLDWLVGKILMLFDFVGDVVSYVGNRKHRRNAEERLLRVIGQVENAAPDAQLLIVGHSLGSILVTQSVLQLRESENLGRRLHVLTMGSPLRLLSWFFPSRILTPEQLLAQFEESNLIFSWANMWRDADIVGRALQVSNGRKFGETSLGDGSHMDYWADARCWQAVIAYVRAIADQSWETLALGWKAESFSENDQCELYLVRGARISRISCLWIIFLFGIWSLDHFWHISEWASKLAPMNKWIAYIISSMILIPMVLWYLFATHPVGVSGSTERELLANYRLNYFISRTCLMLAFVVGSMAGLIFILWRSFTA